MVDTKTGAAAPSEGAAGTTGTTGTTGTVATGTAAAPAAAKPGEAGKTGDQGATGTAGATGTGTAATDGTASKEPAGKAGEETQPKAPEKYELKVPDAGKAYVDDADLTFLEEIARKSDWTQDEAQAALEEHVATIEAQSQRFLAETQKDKTYGGDKLAETKKLVDAAINRIRPAGHDRRESFMRFLNRGGAGNHIEVVAFLADLGRMMGEDGVGHLRSEAPAGKRTEDILYDNPTSKVSG